MSIEAGTAALEGRTARWRRFIGPLLVASGVGLLLTLAFVVGLADHVTDKERLQRTVEDAGAIGPLVFLGLMIVLVPLNIPGLLFVVPSTTLFGTVPGILLSLIGGFIASAIGIVGARHLGRSAFESRMPARVQRFEGRISARGFWAVVLLRSVTFLMQPVDWLCGITSMPMRTVLTATFVGLIPPTVVIALAGEGVIDALL